MPEQQMQASMSKEDGARQRLAAHQDTMISLWGPEYEQHPQYGEALQQVVKGRLAAFVLSDFRGL